MKKNLPFFIMLKNHWFKEHPVVFINTIIFFGCMILSYWLYPGAMTGLSDDWTFIDPTPWSSVGDYIWDAYFHLSGRLAAHLTQFFWWLINLLFGFSPDTYPWWLFLATSLFCIIAAPLNLIIAGQNLAGYEKRVGLFLAIVIWSIWTFSDQVYGASTFATLLNVHILPTFLLSVGLLLFSQLQKNKNRSWWIVLSLLYLYASLSNEQPLASLPIMFSFLSLIQFIRHPQAQTWLRSLSLWIVLSGFSFLIYFISPGQFARNTLVQATVPQSFWEMVLPWYQRVVQEGYATLFADNPITLDCRIFYLNCRTEQVISQSLVIHTLLLLFLVLGSCITGFALYQSRKHQLSGASMLTDVLNTGLLATTFLVGFHTSLLHFFVSAYFRPYALTFPTLLLSTGIVYSVLFFVLLITPNVQCAFVQLFRQESVISQPIKQRVIIRSPGIIFCSFLILFGLFVSVIIPNIKQMINAYYLQIWFRDVRQETYHRVIELHNQTGANNVLLTHCPVDLEDQWGFPSYFGWAGYRSLRVVLQGYRTWYKELEKDSWTPMVCHVPPFIPFTWNEAERLFFPSPVRIIAYQTDDGQGAWDSDFWVSEHVQHCTLTGSYNPDVAKDINFRENFRYHLIYSTGAGKEGAIRFMHVQDSHHAQWSESNVRVTFVQNTTRTDRVPISSFRQDWENRPFVRVHITTPGLTWLGLYSFGKVHMQCD